MLLLECTSHIPPPPSPRLPPSPPLTPSPQPSENPVLASHFGRASVLALQGGPGTAEDYLPAGAVNSLGKHYAAYGASAGGLNGGAADVSNRTLHEYFLRPWIAIGRAGVRSAMASHNTVHDIPAHANEQLIDELRGSFSFGEGVILSDCDDIGVIYDFRMAANRTQAAALALKAGVDWDLQCGTDPIKWSYNKVETEWENRRCSV